MSLVATKTGGDEGGGHESPGRPGGHFLRPVRQKIMSRNIRTKVKTFSLAKLFDREACEDIQKKYHNTICQRSHEIGQDFLDIK